MASEKLYENQIKRWLEKNGVYPLGTAADKMPVAPIGYYIKRWGGGNYVKSGYPDMQIVIMGVCFEVEIKAENGRLSDLQMQKIEQINTSNGYATSTRPSGFDDLKKWIKEVIRWYDELVADNLVL